MPNKVKIVFNMPVISIVMPTFNRSGLIKEAVESVFNQDYSDYEVIIVDDGSTDNTYNSIERYNANIRYIFQNNSGVSKARNTGIRAAKGNYIAFLDSDDLWDPRKLSTQLQFFENNPDSYIYYTREIWMRNNSRVNPPQVYFPGDRNILPKLLKRCFIGASSVMVRKDLFDHIGYFDESLPVCEDLDLWLRIILKFPIFFINKQLTIKRMGQWPQLSTSIWGMDRYRIYIMEKLLNRDSLNPVQKQLFLDTIKQKSYILVKGSLKHKHPVLAIKYGWKYLKHGLTRT